MQWFFSFSELLRERDRLEREVRMLRRQAARRTGLNREFLSTAYCLGLRACIDSIRSLHPGLDTTALEEALAVLSSYYRRNRPGGRSSGESSDSSSGSSAPEHSEG